MKSTITLGLALAALILTACGEKPQVAATKKSDSPPWQGAASGEVVAGWKAGDAASWSEHMRSRAQQGQNEYNRTSAQP